MNEMTKAIYFDMDGTIADFYGVPHWLEYLCESNPHPYEVAAPLLNMSLLARLLNCLQREGWHIGIVSWTSKTGTPAFNSAIMEAKLNWLNHHLHSVHWDEIQIIPYGTPKHMVVQFSEGILFDDETPNRDAWGDSAYDAQNIIEILKGLF